MNSTLNQLYDLGYQDIKDPKMLASLASQLGAIVLDVRFNPRSRDPKWNAGALRLLMGSHYLHVLELGNVNYKTSGAPIKIRDMDTGLSTIRSFLVSRSVILMCACRDRVHCHRLVIAREYLKRYGVESTPLYLKSVISLLDKLPQWDKVLDPQMPLFPLE